MENIIYQRQKIQRQGSSQRAQESQSYTNTCCRLQAPPNSTNIDKIVNNSLNSDQFDASILLFSQYFIIINKSTLISRIL